MGIDLSAVIEDSADAERTHLLDNKKYANMTIDAVLLHGLTTGTEVVALCGYSWVPRHVVNDFPLCGKCGDVLAKRMQDIGVEVSDAADRV